MPTIYISDNGDDKNDGLSLKTAIYSLKRAKELHGGRNDSSWHFGPRAWKRIQKELPRQAYLKDVQIGGDIWQPVIFAILVILISVTLYFILEM